MNRAYGVLEVKNINEESRTISGIATSISPDRMGDVVEPKGAKFSLPIPLLWQHFSSMPIGHVTEAKVTPSGIKVTAQLVKTDMPGALKDRLDEAWQSIKLGLVRGLSIGFRALKYAFMEDNGGVRFSAWEWLELSAVTIPANAEASIQTIKSFDERILKANTPEWHVGAAKDLPINMDATWDGAAAKARMLDAAGYNGDNPNQARARRGFLAYDSANPTLKQAFHLPFADMIDGKLTAVADGLRNAASRLPQTDIPQSVQDSARSVLDGYFARMKKDAGTITHAGIRTPRNTIKLVSASPENSGTERPERAPVKLIKAGG